MAEYLSVGSEQWDAEITDGAVLPQFGISWIEIDDTLGDVHDCAIAHDPFARCSDNVVFVVVDELAVEQERDGPKPVARLRVLGHPDAAGLQDLREVAQ